MSCRTRGSRAVLDPVMLSGLAAVCGLGSAGSGGGGVGTHQAASHPAFVQGGLLESVIAPGCACLSAGYLNPRVPAPSRPSPKSEVQWPGEQPQPHRKLGGVGGEISTGCQRRPCK